MYGYENVEHPQHYDHEDINQNGEYEYEEYQPEHDQPHQPYNNYSHPSHQRNFSQPNTGHYDYGYDRSYPPQQNSSSSSGHEVTPGYNNYYGNTRRYSNQYTYDNRNSSQYTYDHRNSYNGQYYYDRRASTGQFDNSVRSSAQSSQNHSRVFSVSTQPTTITEPPGENERIVADQLNITSLKSLGLNDSRYIIETDFTWFIDDWKTLIKDSTGLVLGPPVYIEGYYWNMRLYPDGEVTTTADTKSGARQISMYLKARPKRSNCIDWPVSTEYTFTLWNPKDSEKFITKQLQNQTLSYTSTMNGFTEFETVSNLRQQGIISDQNQLNITVHLKFMKSSLYGR